MSPALRFDGVGHLSRKITLTALPLDRESEPDATGYSCSDDDNPLHSDIGLRPHLSGVANISDADRPIDSSSMKKSSS